MLNGIDALLALQRYATVSEAAIRLNLTQSAVSKRIRGLQDELGYTIVEPEGRKLRITPQGLDFLERARPLAELRGLKTPVEAAGFARYSLAMADSIASSWGPAVLRSALSAVNALRIDLHSHRSVLVVESVLLGRYHVGMCSDVPGASELIHHPLTEEPMVLLNASLAGRPARDAPLISIEPSSAAWRAIEPKLRALQPVLARRTRVPVESFSAGIQMVSAGFGDGLVPLGLVLESRLGRGCYRVLPGVTRPVALLTRKTVNGLESFSRLREGLQRATATYFAKAR
jgi:DNA-binding transcriptional LysR family regulator